MVMSTHGFTQGLDVVLNDGRQVQITRTMVIGSRHLFEVEYASKLHIVSISDIASRV